MLKRFLHLTYRLSILFFTGMRERGMSETVIANSRIHVKKDQRLRDDRERGNQSIIWSANDSSQYSFFWNENPKDEDTPPREVSCSEYYRERHRMPLKYEHMPLLHVEKGQWYPIEFCFQGFGRVKNANSPEHVQAKLEFCDQNAGSQLLNIYKECQAAEQKVQKYGMTIANLLAKFNFRKAEHPVTLEAKLLKEPNLFLGNENARIINGDWSLMSRGRGKSFPK